MLRTSSVTRIKRVRRHHRSWHHCTRIFEAHGAIVRIAPTRARSAPCALTPLNGRSYILGRKRSGRSVNHHSGVPFANGMRSNLRECKFAPRVLRVWGRTPCTRSMVDSMKIAA